MTEKKSRLRKLMADHQLTSVDVAALLGRKPQTVRIWKCVRSRRDIPSDALALLEVRLEPMSTAQ